MKIAVDAMGGDNAPGEIVKGALQAVEEYGVAVTLVGDENQVRAELGSGEAAGLVNVVHAPEVIEMKDHPAVAVRRKKNSSIVRATQLVKEGEADAVVSAGNTGASMTSALLSLGRIKGIDRPAIAVVLPSEKDFTLLLDIGANVDCKPHNLFQFGMMGHLYAHKILGVDNPRVGLLSNGEEETKGNEATLAAFPLLQKAGINFIGNVEGGEIFRGTAHVLVCDGFLGNIVLKAGEGLAESLFNIMKEEIAKSFLAKLGIVMAGAALKGFQRRIEYTEYGGAPLLGVNGVSVICHGRSTAKAIKNAIRVAMESVDNSLVDAIRDSITIAEKKEVDCADAQGSG
ncbi:phosphate acyltransferase PlsX [Pelotomaculum terephthalicicum JT]|uniref:phosphate acyltransferase PlsX n=1 Tax=Pelotomaculum TaxID=191373 RepID=UPI0009C540C2|nr:MULTISPECIES: phosphate acyltransferase PlsX [Pelotomaculum]MCG9969772.1 phosphate acyltransferase PlsX [Pelotomaculum terephthalicicum JT]OPX84793.1 MAG: Phosphate acyltransferase [Pelotomaculum sp. PtaB.Bin117]OPY62161.1 MAG: Phosphate acyltransferase [Pelotomaculum sp. PtaU1.Bin065]